MTKDLERSHLFAGFGVFRRKLDFRNASHDRGTFTVKKGDTLFRIAQELGVSIVDLQEFNAIDDVNKLAVGQQLVIPNGKMLSNDACKKRGQWGVFSADVAEDLGDASLGTSQSAAGIKTLNHQPEGVAASQHLRMGGVHSRNPFQSTLEGAQNALHACSSLALAMIDPAGGVGAAHPGGGPPEGCYVPGPTPGVRQQHALGSVTSTRNGMKIRLRTVADHKSPAAAALLAAGEGVGQVSSNNLVSFLQSARAGLELLQLSAATSSRVNASIAARNPGGKARKGARGFREEQHSHILSAVNDTGRAFLSWCNQNGLVHQLPDGSVGLGRAGKNDGVKMRLNPHKLQEAAGESSPSALPAHGWVQRANACTPEEVQVLDWQQLGAGWQLVPCAGSNPQRMPALFSGVAELAALPEASKGERSGALLPAAATMINVMLEFVMAADNPVTQFLDSINAPSHNPLYSPSAKERYTGMRSSPLGLHPDVASEMSEHLQAANVLLVPDDDEEEEQGVDAATSGRGASSANRAAAALDMLFEDQSESTEARLERFLSSPNKPQYFNEILGGAPDVVTANSQPFQVRPVPMSQVVVPPGAPIMHGSNSTPMHATPAALAQQAALLSTVNPQSQPVAPSPRQLAPPDSPEPALGAFSAEPAASFVGQQSKPRFLDDVSERSQSTRFSVHRSPGQLHLTAHSITDTDNLSGFSDDMEHDVVRGMDTQRSRVRMSRRGARWAAGPGKEVPKLEAKAIKSPRSDTSVSTLASSVTLASNPTRVSDYAPAARNPVPAGVPRLKLQGLSTWLTDTAAPAAEKSQKLLNPAARPSGVRSGVRSGAQTDRGAMEMRAHEAAVKLEMRKQERSAKAREEFYHLLATEAAQFMSPQPQVYMEGASTHPDVDGGPTPRNLDFDDVASTDPAHASPTNLQALPTFPSPPRSAPPARGAEPGSETTPPGGSAATERSRPLTERVQLAKSSELFDTPPTSPLLMPPPPSRTIQESRDLAESSAPPSCLAPTKSLSEAAESATGAPDSSTKSRPGDSVRGVAGDRGERRAVPMVLSQTRCARRAPRTRSVLSADGQLSTRSQPTYRAHEESASRAATSRALNFSSQPLEQAGDRTESVSVFQRAAVTERDHLQREKGRLEAYFASTVSPDTETQSAETKACVSQESSKLLVHDTPRIPESTEEEDVTKDKLASDQVPTKALPWAHGPESNSHLHSTRGNPERNSSETKAVEEFVCEVNVPLKEQSQQASVQAPDVMEKKPKSRMGMFRCLACAGTCTS